MAVDASGALSELLTLAAAHGCGALVIEDLDFADARAQGRERTGNRPQGGRGRRFRALVAGIPTAGRRDRLTQMATNRGLSVIAVDPAYTSRLGAEHWLGRRPATVLVADHHRPPCRGGGEPELEKDDEVAPECRLLRNQGRSLGPAARSEDISAVDLNEKEN